MESENPWIKVVEEKMLEEYLIEEAIFWEQMLYGELSEDGKKEIETKIRELGAQNWLNKLKSQLK